MSGDLSLAVVAGIFFLSVAVVIVLGLFVISVVLRAQHKYRRRLSRVSRRRLSGRLDLDEARLVLVRQKQDTNALMALSEALARFVPLLDTVRLRANLHRAGMSLSVGGFIMVSIAVAGLLAIGGSFASGYPIPLLLVPATFGAMFLVNAFIKLRGSMRSNRFMKQLPDAIDTIIRGIRAGLPVIECIGTVGKEFDDPVGGRFQAISERVALGETLDAALWRTARVIDRPEMDFLAISIAIQMETGGSLAEALGNLADLLRQRERMKLKIKAISSEAKASAMIIGALPFVMLGMLTMMSPEYVMPLFTDPRGNMMLMAGAGSMFAGAFVMWRMTQFEI